MARVQRTLFDLDKFQEVTLVKDFTDPQPVSTVQDALARLGNDSAKLIEIINDGILAEERRKHGSDPSGWHSLTDEGEVNGEFTGTVADQKKVNALVLTLAKTVFGYSKDLSTDAKNQSREQAVAMIKNTPAIREGLKKSAALTDDKDEQNAVA